MKGDGIASIIVIILAVLFLVAAVSNFAEITDELLDGFTDDSESTESEDGIINGSTGNGSSDSGNTDSGSGDNTGTGDSSGDNTGNGSTDSGLSESVMEKYYEMLTYEHFYDMDTDLSYLPKPAWIFCADEDIQNMLEKGQGRNVTYGIVMGLRKYNGEVLQTESPIVSYSEDGGFTSSYGQVTIVHNTDGKYSPSELYFDNYGLGFFGNPNCFSAKVTGLTEDVSCAIECRAFVMLDYQYLYYADGGVYAYPDDKRYTVEGYSSLEGNNSDSGSTGDSSGDSTGNGSTDGGGTGFDITDLLG